MKRPDISEFVLAVDLAADVCYDDNMAVTAERLKDAADAILAYIRELEAERKALIENPAFVLIPTENLKRLEELEAANKRIEQETAFKCAYLAWQSQHISGAAHKYICREYGLNLDSLYSTTWKELNK